MNGPAFHLAIRQSARTAAIVSIGLGLFYWVIMLSSSSFAGDSADLPKFFLKPPRAVSALVGGSTDFLSARGWLATGMFHPIVLSLQTAGAFLVAAASGATELERGTLDLVLSRPVPRGDYLRARMAAGIVLLGLVELGGITGILLSRATIPTARSLDMGNALLGFAGSWLLFTAFSMITLWVFVRAHLRSRALGASIGIVVSGFFVNFVSLLFDHLRWMRFATPFHYFRAGDVVNEGRLPADLLILFGLALVFGSLALRDFRRRDLSR